MNEEVPEETKEGRKGMSPRQALDSLYVAALTRLMYVHLVVAQMTCSLNKDRRVEES